MILLTYLISDRGNDFRIHVRALFTWLFVWALCSVIPDLLQCYMDQAIPAVSIILSEPSPPTADRIMYPFRSRFQRLVQTGSLLVTFPFILIALVMVGHLCNIHSDIYPIAYKGMTLDKSARTTLHYWEKKLVVEMANSAIECYWIHLTIVTNKSQCMWKEHYNPSESIEKRLEMDESSS